MDTNPPPQGALLLVTQIELVSATTAAGTLYGVAFTLYCLYLHATLPQLRDHDRRRQTQFMMTYSTILMVCALYSLVSNAWVAQDAYIKHSDFPGGPFIYEGSTFHTQPVIAVGIVCQLAIDMLTAAIQIWRLWVVWTDSRYTKLVVILPLLSFLGFTGLQILIVVLDITTPNAHFIGSLAINLGTAGFAMRGTATILPTILIAGLIIFRGRRQRKLTGKPQLSSQYMGVVAMLIESYTLESIWTIVFMILFSVHHPVESFFNETLPYIEVIAYLLVMYRVANGRTCGSHRVHGSSSRCDNISSLHWNHATMESGVTNVTDTNTHCAGIRPEPNDPV